MEKYSSRNILSFIHLTDQTVNYCNESNFTTNASIILSSYAMKKLGKILARYSKTVDDFIFMLENYIRVMNIEFPWAICCYPKDIKLAGHFLRHRGMLNIRYLSYWQSNEDSLPSTLGVIMFFDKESLRLTANRSVLFEKTSAVLLNKDTLHRWIIFPDLPSREWMRHYKAIDGPIFCSISQHLHW